MEAAELSQKRTSVCAAAVKNSLSLSKMDTGAWVTILCSAVSAVLASFRSPRTKEWKYFPPESLFQAWPRELSLDASRLGPPLNRTVSGPQAFLVASAAQRNYSLPWTQNELGTARRPAVPLRVCMLGEEEDVGAADFEVVIDQLDVLRWAAPSLEIGLARSYAACNFGVYIVNAPNEPAPVWRSYDPLQPTGEFRFWPDDSPQLLLVRVSNQSPPNRTGFYNRHAITHEMGHAMGLPHYPFSPSAMGPPAGQLGYWSSTDLSVLSALRAPNLTNSDVTLQQVCASLAVVCPESVTSTQFAAGSYRWDDVARWQCERTAGRDPVSLPDCSW